MASRPFVPKPGPAKLQPGAGLDQWLEEAKQCHYLPEAVMKTLCEMVKEVLMEGLSLYWAAIESDGVACCLNKESLIVNFFQSLISSLL
jgi:hypothetical protein